MSDPSWKWTVRWREGRFLAGAGLLVAVVTGLCALLLPGIYWWQGISKFLEAGAAAMLCLLSGITAIAATSCLARQQQPLAGLLLAMALRMLPPLVVCLLLSFQGDGDKYLGFIAYLLLFYGITLAIETYLSIQRVRPKQSL